MAIPSADAALSAESRSPWQLAFRRFRKNGRAVVCMILLTIVGLATLLYPWITPHDYRYQDLDNSYKAPGSYERFRYDHDGNEIKERVNYVMGTDGNGRDLAVRVFRGGRISFAVGILATLVSVIVGVGYGAVSAYFGGRVDLVMMRFVDVLYGLPHMMIVIIVMAIFQQRSFLLVFLVLGLFGWFTMSRIVRGQILSLKEREFVEAARALGAGAPMIIWRHMIPNILGPVIIYTTLSIPAVILSESFLSFLGLGISEPNTSWGVLIDEGAKALNPEKNLSWLVGFPGLCLALTLFCLNAVGDGLRDALDVQQR
jgi:oligopeptide transport system permease protein